VRKGKATGADRRKRFGKSLSSEVNIVFENKDVG
jgi:hypothetical protein